MLFNNIIFSRIRHSLAFRLLGREGVASLVNSQGLAIRAARYEVAAFLDAELNATVAHGPFKGLKLSSAKGWNSLDRAGILLGLYECELVELMEEAFSRPRPFVDVGAADGYYAVGALTAGWCTKAVAFEASPERQALIEQTAELNGVADRLTILGEASEDFIERARDALGSTSDAVWLFDVEGAEFDLLSTRALSKLTNATVFVEVHRWADKNGERRAALETRAEHFSLKSFGTGPRDPGAFEELAHLSDDKRWLVCSERRRLPGLWWRLVGPAVQSLDLAGPPSESKQ